MTCKIERLVSGENTVVIRVCGRIQVEHVSTVKELIGQEQGEDDPHRAVTDIRAAIDA